jgi:hypothetical protein
MIESEILIPQDQEKAARSTIKTTSSKRSKLSKNDITDTIENQTLEERFRSADLYLSQRQEEVSTVPEVNDSGLEYSMINLKTVDDIDEELMLRPILNVSVLGRIDNLKVIFGL